MFENCNNLIVIIRNDLNKIKPLKGDYYEIQKVTIVFTVRNYINGIC